MKPTPIPTIHTKRQPSRDGETQKLMELVAARVQKLRASAQLSQQAFALAADLSPSTVKRLELAHKPPDLATLIAIARYFEISVAELLTIPEP